MHSASLFFSSRISCRQLCSMGTNDFCHAKKERPGKEKAGRVRAALCCIPGGCSLCWRTGIWRGRGEWYSSSCDFPGLWPEVTGRSSTATLQLLAAFCQRQLFVLPVELGVTVPLIILYWLCTWGYSAPF